MGAVLLVTAYLCCASGSLAALAVLLYRYDQHSAEQRHIAEVALSVSGATLAFATLVWMQSRLVTPEVRALRAPGYTILQPWPPTENLQMRD